jgi:Uma2 family endonuclease
MVTMVIEGDKVSVPTWVKDLASFRRWAQSDDFPESGRICYLDGDVWIDMSKEQLFTHAKLKGEFNRVLCTLVKREKLGHLFPDGILLSSVEADISNQPDATFVSFAALEDKVRLIEGKEEGYVELEGAPDMVLEVVSKSSVHKDTVTLRQAYWEAGILEYWLVDGRKEPFSFEILRHTARGYVAARKTDGWIKSPAFGQAFRLFQERDARGNPEFTLEMR